MIAIGVVVILVAGLLIFLYLPKGGNPSSTSGVPTVVIVLLPNGVGVDQALNFQPAGITVVIGINNTIQWVDKDVTPHTVTSTNIPSGSKPFDSSTINQGQTYSVTLTVPGTYSYYCSIHPTWMKGVITVKP